VDVVREVRGARQETGVVTPLRLELGGDVRGVAQKLYTAARFCGKILIDSELDGSRFLTKSGTKSGKHQRIETS
jgi:hypothetical protein